MLEYESVLTRPEHLAACGASREDVSAVLDELALVGKRVELMIRLVQFGAHPGLQGSHIGGHIVYFYNL
jgi:hypothetical protein